MADQRPKEDPINKVKLIARNMLDGIFDDLMDKNVINRDELQRLGEGVSLIVNGTESLLEDLTEKTEMAGKIFMNRFFKNKKQLSLKLHPEDKNDESENESESNESESNESESNESSAAESPSESEENEDENRAEPAQASAPPRSVPRETQASQFIHKLKLCSPDHFHRLRTTKADEIYPVMEKEGRTRLALIIYNQEFVHLPNRRGGEVDLLGTQDLLENLGYSVVVEKNLTALEMQTALYQFAARPEHQASDSTILVFMSHGVLEGICGTKYSDKTPDVLYDDIIFQIFNNRNCHSLRDKPKVIIMQACRGSGNGTVWVTDEGATSGCKYDPTLQCYIWSDAVAKTHVEKDFIAFKSSTPHNKSWRKDAGGSLFISQIIYHFKEYSWCLHLEGIFRKVQRSFETPKEMAQMPTIERVSMTRYFYLFPGN